MRRGTWHVARHVMGGGRGGMRGEMMPRIGYYPGGVGSGARVVASGSGRARGTVVVVVVVVDRRNAKMTTGLGFRFARAMKDGDDLDHVVADSGCSE